MSSLIVIFNIIKYNLAIIGPKNSCQLFAKIFSGNIQLSPLKTLLLVANIMSPLKKSPLKDIILVVYDDLRPDEAPVDGVSIMNDIVWGWGWGWGERVSDDPFL